MVPYRLAAKAPREFPLIRNIRRNLTTIDERVEEGAIYQMLTYASCHLKGSEKVAWRRYGRGLGLGPGINPELWEVIEGVMSGICSRPHRPDMIHEDDNVDLSIHSVDV